VELFGGHVIGRPKARKRCSVACAFHRVDDTKVEQLNPPRVGQVQEDIFGFEIAVDHAILMGKNENFRHFRKDLQRIVKRQRLLLVQKLP
jgi:hypothetical protein